MVDVDAILLPGYRIFTGTLKRSSHRPTRRHDTVLSRLVVVVNCVWTQSLDYSFEFYSSGQNNTARPAPACVSVWCYTMIADVVLIVSRPELKWTGIRTTLNCCCYDTRSLGLYAEIVHAVALLYSTTSCL